MNSIFKVVYRCNSCNEIVTKKNMDGGVVLYDTEQSEWRMYCFPCAVSNHSLKQEFIKFAELSFFMDMADTHEKFDIAFEERISKKRPDLLRATLANLVLYRDKPSV